MLWKPEEQMDRTILAAAIAAALFILLIVFGALPRMPW